MKKKTRKKVVNEENRIIDDENAKKFFNALIEHYKRNNKQHFDFMREEKQEMDLFTVMCVKHNITIVELLRKAYSENEELLEHCSGC